MELIATYWGGEEFKNEPGYLDFNWPAFYQLEDNGKLAVYTARDKETDKLLGISVYAVVVQMHFREFLTAYCDGLCVRKSCRGENIGGALLAYCEIMLTRLGVKEIRQGYRTAFLGKESPLFPKLGYVVDEIIYKKRL